MRKYKVFSVILCLLFVAGIVWATPSDFGSVRTKDSGDSDTYLYEAQNSSGTRLFSVSNTTGNVYTAGTLNVTGATTLGTATITTGNITTATITTLSHSRERGFTLPLAGFVLSSGEPVSYTTAPGMEIDDYAPNIVWSDGETTPVIITFRVPYDYSSAGAFRLICTESDSTTPNQVDFDVYVNANGVAADSSATGQTPVALTQNTSTPSVVTLTPATDFASLAAGQWVTLRIWRDDTADGTGDLEVKGVEFFYTASQ